MTRTHRVTTAVLLLSLLVFVPRIAMDDNSRAELENLRGEVEALSDQNEDQRRLNRELFEEVNALTTDATSIESRLRSTYRLVREDETVFYFQSSDPGASE